MRDGVMQRCKTVCADVACSLGPRTAEHRGEELKASHWTELHCTCTATGGWDSLFFFFLCDRTRGEDKATEGKTEHGGYGDWG